AGVLRLSDLDFTAGGTRLAGNVSQDKAGLLTGQVQLTSADISTAAALLLQKATGAANASITLSAADGKQAAAISGTVKGLSTQGRKFGAADVQSPIADLFGIPQVEGSVSCSALQASGIEVATLNATASRSGQTTSFDGGAGLTNGTRLDVAGAL